MIKNFTIIPNQILGPSQLSASARFLYCVLLKYCGRDDSCFPGQTTLGGVLGFSDRHIRTLLAELIKNKLVSKKRSGWNRSNTYIVTKILETSRKYISTPSQNSNSSHLGSMVPIHNAPVVPPNNTYLKGKDKRSIKGLEKLRKSLEELKIIPCTTIEVKPQNEPQKRLIID